MLHWEHTCFGAWDRLGQTPSDSFAILIILDKLLTPPLRAYFPGLWNRAL